MSFWLSQAHTGAPLPEMIKWYKTQTTNAYIRLVKQGQALYVYLLSGSGGYYDHVIRNDTDLAETRQYIANNPLNWTLNKD